MPQTIEERVRGLVSDLCEIPDPKDLDLDAHWDSLGLDSADSVELLLKVQEEFELPIDDDEFFKLKSPHELVELLKGKQEPE